MTDDTKRSKIIGGFSNVLTGRIASTGFSAIFYFVFAALLDPAEYGELSYIIAIASTFALVSRFGLNHSVEVYQAKKDSELTSQINTLAFILILGGSLIILFIDPLASLLALTFSFFVMDQFNLLGQRRYKRFRNLAIFKSISYVIFPLILYQFWEIHGIILGISIAYLLSTYFFVRRIRRITLSFNRVKSNFKVLLNNFGVDSSSSLVRSIDKLVIVPVLGFTYTGIYQFNFVILSGLEVLPIALHSFFLAEESSGKRNTKLAYLLILLSILVVVIVFLVAAPIVEWLFPKYSEGIPSLKIMSISIIPMSIGAFLNAKLQAKESRQVGYSAIVRIGSLLSLIVFLAEPYGLMGLSLAVLISILLNTGFLFLLYIKENKKVEF